MKAISYILFGIILLGGIYFLTLEIDKQDKKADMLRVYNQRVKDSTLIPMTDPHNPGQKVIDALDKILQKDSNAMIHVE